jgi:hypothetical protein
LLNNDTFADFDFEDVDLLDGEPKVPCAFPKALFAAQSTGQFSEKTQGSWRSLGLGQKLCLLLPE